MESNRKDLLVIEANRYKFYRAKDFEGNFVYGVYMKEVAQYTPKEGVEKHYIFWLELEESTIPPEFRAKKVEVQEWPIDAYAGEDRSGNTIYQRDIVKGHSNTSWAVDEGVVSLSEAEGQFYLNISDSDGWRCKKLNSYSKLELLYEAET